MYKGFIFNIFEDLSYLGVECWEYEDSFGVVVGGEVFYYVVLYFWFDDVIDVVVEMVVVWLKCFGGDGVRYLFGFLSDIGLGRCLYLWGGFF